MSAVQPNRTDLFASTRVLGLNLDVDALRVRAPAHVVTHTMARIEALVAQAHRTAASRPLTPDADGPHRREPRTKDLGGGAGPVGADAGDDDSPSTEAPIEPLDPVAISMEELVRDHADAVYRVALSVTRDPSLAEDASQDALIKAWQALPSFRGDAPLRNWVLRIAHNTSVSLLRRRREDVRAPADLPEPTSNQASVERQVQDRLAIDRFERALQQLDNVSRSIVVLREVEGLSYHEISEVLQLPLPTIKTRLLRARRQLATALEGWQP